MVTTRDGAGILDAFTVLNLFSGSVGCLAVEVQLADVDERGGAARTVEGPGKRNRNFNCFRINISSTYKEAMNQICHIMKLRCMHVASQAALKVKEVRAFSALSVSCTTHVKKSVCFHCRYVSFF